MTDPYRTAAERFVASPRPNFVVRAWRAVFGYLTYGGEENCGHCRYWKPVWNKEKREVWSDFWAVHVDKVFRVKAEKGDCKLIYGREDTLPTDTCPRFKARRRYKHRERV